MHYELAPWLPALWSQVPALAGCCDTSHAVNMLVQVGVSPLICRVCVQIVSLSRTGSFSKHFGSLSLASALLQPLTPNSLPPGCSSKAGRASVPHSLFSKHSKQCRTAGVTGDQQAVSAVQSLWCCAVEISGIRGRRASCCSPALQLILADPGHNIHIHVMHSLFVTILDAQLTSPANVSNRDREVVVNNSLEMTCCW